MGGVAGGGKPDGGSVLYRVVGLDPEPGGWSEGLGLTLYSTRRGRTTPLTVMGSRQRWFRADDGSHISLTSHLRGGEEHFGRLRTWAVSGAYMATSQGRRAAATWDSSEPFPGTLDAEWFPATFVVDGVATAFDVCDLGEGIWVAVGRLAEVDVTLDSRGVPQGDVRLARLAEGERLVPRMPPLGDSGSAIAADLESRFALVPFRRVRRMGDYWALTGIEREHIDRLAERYGLSGAEQEGLQVHWIGRIDAELADTVERLQSRSRDVMRPRRLYRVLRWNWLFQLWFKTFGPGARTWFGNRYATIRPHTFRLRWRP